MAPAMVTGTRSEAPVAAEPERKAAPSPPRGRCPTPCCGCRRPPATPRWRGRWLARRRPRSSAAARVAGARRAALGTTTTCWTRSSARGCCAPRSPAVPRCITQGFCQEPGVRCDVLLMEAAATPLRHPRITVLANRVLVDGLAIDDATAVELVRARLEAGDDPAAVARRRDRDRRARAAPASRRARTSSSSRRSWRRRRASPRPSSPSAPARSPRSSTASSTRRSGPRPGTSRGCSPSTSATSRRWRCRTSSRPRSPRRWA